MKISTIIKVALTGLLLTFSACSSSGSADGGSEATLSIYGSMASLASANVSNLSRQVGGTGSLSALNVTVYAVYLSPNADCTGATLVQDYGAEPLSTNFADNPELFSGTPEEGTYECVILAMDDVMTFSVDEDAAAANPICGDTTTEHEMDIYRTDDSSIWYDVNGNTITPHGTSFEPEADVVYIFASTDTDAIAETTASIHQVVSMDNALAVPGTSTFVIDFTNKVTTEENDGSEYCSVNPGTFSFE